MLRPTEGISLCWPHNGDGVCFPIQQFLQSTSGTEQNRLHKKLWLFQQKKKKISKANLPGAVLLRCDCETTEMLFNSLHDPKTQSMYSLELKQLICSDKGHSHSLNQFHHIIILLFTKQSKCSARESIVGLLTAVGMFTSPYAWPHIWCLTHTHLLWNTKIKRNFGVVFG